jgi:2-keto-4-pentenoate hydratase
MNLDDVAVQQLGDYDSKEIGTVFNDTTFTVSEAYEIQGKVAALREQRGETVIGFKTGCVSPALRESVGISHPVFGRLWDTEQWQSGVHLEPAQFAEPAIEGELAVHLAKDLRGSDISERKLLDAIDSVFVVIEMHNKVFRGTPSGAELIANNTIHAGVIHTAEKAATLPDAPGPLTITIDGMQIAQVPGQDLRSTILDSLRWLAEELGKHDLAMLAGHTILCGTISDIHLIDSGAQVVVTTEDFGSVTMQLG